MFRHFLKLIWKRKGRNLMLSLEILIAFVIVFAIAAFALRYLQLYRMPIGFEHQDVWSVHIQGSSGGRQDLDAAGYDRLRRGVLELEAVKAAGFASAAPYMRRTMSTRFVAPASTRQVRTETVDASDEVFAILGIALAEGRAYGPADDGAAATPVVINRSLARELFGSASAVGQVFAGSGGAKAPMMKVVGVIETLRQKGELDSPTNFALVRQQPGAENGPRVILLKMAPGTTRAAEEALSRKLKLIDNQLTYEVSPVAALRSSMLSSSLTPLVILSVIGAFMLLMVAFGLFGVLWQNTTQRIPEIGLRRAVGANAGDIYRQIIGEQFLLSSGAILVALVLLVQLPLTGALGDSLNWTVFLAATGLSMAVIYLLSLLCSLYPGWRASRLSPTAALHYE